MIPTPQEVAAKYRTDLYTRINSDLKQFGRAFTTVKRIADEYHDAGYFVEFFGDDMRISLPEELL